MRLMSYNIEWFDDHFEPDNSLKTDAASMKKFAAVAATISAIDPDLIGITEGPNTTTTTGERDTVKALETFAAEKGLRQRKALIGFPSPGRQEIAALYDPDVLSATHDPGGRAGAVRNPRLDESFQIDSDADGIKEIYRHYRPPLEARITRADGAPPFWIMVVHAKSKGIFTAQDRVHFERTSERNRRKLFAECTSVRIRVDEWLDADRPVAVMGDVNDGPGFDFYESRFGRSAVELIMGNIFEPDRLLRYPLGEPKWGRYGWEPSTARFTDRFTGDLVNALIDHIMVSRHFTPQGERPARVWNPYQFEEAEPLKSALRDASDHFPVTLDIV
ncbi:endonuclease/exonuclease/phosphatase family protein [Amaricoccus macauensis]|uniref:endonuclease/exonuclease/phosphatase family protein n=1 Tax=Amaricoccus macauensis TaxID=57001 RepID=UPI003C7C3344